jgi:hypothetical protein
MTPFGTDGAVRRRRQTYEGEEVMPSRCSIIATVLAMTMYISAIPGAQAFDEAKYPNWRGQWSAPLAYQFGTNPSWDQTKAQGLAQQAPLIPEYQALHEASLADVAAGGAGLDRDFLCITPGMPRMMNVYSTMEIRVLPDTTYMLFGFVNDVRRIYTDGREWPANIEPSYAGYSIGNWIDMDGDGRFDVLEIETRGFKGPRTLDSTAIPLHADNQTIVKERIFDNAADHNILYDEITLIDNAFTHPWTVTKQYSRRQQAQPLWREAECAENNAHTRIGKQDYMMSGDGFLMPAKKDQPPPDLRYFNNARR